MFFLRVRLSCRGNSGAARESELLREAEVVPARPLLRDPRAVEPQQDEPADLAVAAGLAVARAHRHARGDAPVVAEQVVHLVLDAVEGVGVARHEPPELVAPALLDAGERVD